MTVREILSRLNKVRRNGKGWLARCPSHDDRNPSLSVNEEGDSVLLHCHAGCTLEQICAAIGIQMRDLFLNDSPRSSPEPTIATIYPYTDEHGRLLFQVLRYTPKTFKQRRPDGNGGWAWNLDGVRRVLYRLPEVGKAKSIIIVEGERDADTASSMDLIGTCNPGGAGKWRTEYSEALRGKDVAIIADADAPGLKHARDVVRSLVGIAHEVKLIEALPAAKDLTEWFQRGGTKDALLSLIERTPVLTSEGVAKWFPAKNGDQFALRPLAELLAKPDTPVEYIWDGRLVAGTVSLLVSKPKVGKSTFARNLCLAVSRGEPFLGLETQQGECIYLALEERWEEIRNDFAAMGADGTEQILIHAAAAPAEGMFALVKLVRERKPRLVVIDPLFRIARIKDERAYAETYAALGPLIDVARETGTHLMLLHHSGKGMKADAIDAPLGSTALGGAVYTLVVLKRGENYRTIQTVQRVPTDLPETVLVFDMKTRQLSLGADKSQADIDSIAADMIEYLQTVEPDEKTESEINDHVEGKTSPKRKALRSLVEQGKITRKGTGKKGDPFTYKCSFPCSQHITGTRERESQKSPAPRINAGAILVPENTENPILVPERVRGEL
jgi:hypothetical protein